MSKDFQANMERIGQQERNISKEMETIKEKSHRDLGCVKQISEIENTLILRAK